MRSLGRFIWRFMVIFSFIVNIVLVIVLLVAGAYIFQIKNEIAQPLVNGLHSSFVGLDQATIDWTIPVRDRIPVVLNIPLQTNTDVTLTEAVPLAVNATIMRQGVDILGGPVTVYLNLPAGTQLPVALDLNVPVDEELDVSLDVRAVIPLQGTQLHDVADNLRLLFEPLAFGLSNLPNNFGEAGELVGDILSGNFDPEQDLLLNSNEYVEQPWPGYSMTAGFGYSLGDEPVPPQNLPLQTGIVPQGGIPGLDEILRPALYENGNEGPMQVNALAEANLASRSISPIYYNGEVGNYLLPMPAANGAMVTPAEGVPTGDAVGGPEDTSEGESAEDLGIISPPSS